MACALIVLAAGLGTRMKSDRPKVLHEIAHAPLVGHALMSASGLNAERTIVVAGHGADAVGAATKEFDETAEIVLQEEQLGTGHAARMAAPALDGFAGDAFVIFADTPFIRAETFQKMVAARQTADIVVLGFTARDPARYGRLITDGDRLLRIVEFKDASDEERAVTLCNSGVLCADAALLTDLLAALQNDNVAGEYYLTDVVALAVERGLTAKVVTCDEAETLGVNSRADLAAAEAVFQARARAEALENGVTLQAPDTVQFAFDTVIGRDALIEPNVVFGPSVTVESGARIRAFSHLEGAHVSKGAIVGPYARLRPGAEIADDARIGNFVEVKNAEVQEGAKINHLSYVGDAFVGAKANVGAGTVTCNYDGFGKHRTEIGAGAFIGSDTMLVAPVRVGERAMTASGSVITSDVPDDALAIGRADQVTRAGYAKRLLAAFKKRAGK